jgi:hypothetical protein
MGTIDRPETSENNYQHMLVTLEKSENLDNYIPNEWKVSLRFKYVSKILYKYIYTDIDRPAWIERNKIRYNSLVKQKSQI